MLFTSNFREIPDNQEVFADGHTDRSVVVEIAEMANVSDEKCAEFVSRYSFKFAFVVITIACVLFALCCKQCQYYASHLFML
jgi:cation transport ATPase